MKVTLTLHYGNYQSIFDDHTAPAVGILSLVRQNVFLVVRAKSLTAVGRVVLVSNMASHF